MAVIAAAQITLTGVTDVQAVYRYYLLQSSTLAKPAVPSAFPPGGSWSDTEPGYTSGSTSSLYVVDCTLFSDDTWQYSPVSLSSAYEAAKAAYNKAVSESSAIRGELNLSYVKKEDSDQVVSMLNASAEVIRLLANRLIIQSSGFTLDGNGDVTATKGTIGGLTLSSNSLTATYRHNYPTFTQADVDKAQQYVAGLATLTPEEFAKYNVNMDGHVTSVDVLGMKKMLAGMEPGYSVYKLTIDASDPSSCVVIEIIEGYHAGWSTKLGIGGIQTRDISTERLYLSIPLEISGGGTGANNAASARENLGVAEAVEDATYAGCYYRTVGGVTEWLNPPMVLGVEYRTTERWNGSAVYVKALDIGALPNASYKTAAATDPHCRLIRFDGCMVLTSTSATFPLTTINFISDITLDFNSGYLVITTTADASGFHGYPIIYYTKQ